MSSDYTADVDANNPQLPEKSLFAAIINTAISDARKGDATKSLLAREAMDFLLSSRVDPYLELLGYEPDVFKEALVATNSTECNMVRAVDRERENRSRRLFRHNLKDYRAKGGKFVLPYDMIYNYSGDYV